MAVLKIENRKVEYIEKGQGQAILLLHGYLESLDVWGDFFEILSKNFRTIAIDLPGHGKTDTFGDVHSIDFMSEIINKLIEHLHIDNVSLIGHSMGGYVAMQFLATYPQKVNRLCLFHSTPFADDEERKQQRDKIISLIKSGKKILLAKEHVIKTFASINVEKLTEDVGFLKIIAVNTSTEATISTLRGLKQRKDYSETFSNTQKPILWILGQKDKFIPVDIYKNIKMPEKIKIEILKKSGHQGFIEEKTKSIKIIKKFMAD